MQPGIAVNKLIQFPLNFDLIQSVLLNSIHWLKTFNHEWINQDWIEIKMAEMN